MKKINKIILFVFLLGLISFTAYSQTEFITKWNTGSNSSLAFPGVGNNYTIVVKDNLGTPVHTNTAATGTILLPYTVPSLIPGTDYTIEITPGSGTFNSFYAPISPDMDKLLEVQQWGNITWTTMQAAFRGAVNMQVTATDMLVLPYGVEEMFRDCYALIGNSSFNTWNTNNVGTMTSMFFGATNFNAPIGNWNTSNVTSMSQVFREAASFNQDIGNWNTTNVTTMYTMFLNAAVFNQDIGSWNTTNVTDMNGMFYGAAAFNQDIGNWNTGNVTNMTQMFRYAASFNQDIGNWNTANVTDMSVMFEHATNFNQDIGNWNVVNVINMSEMFHLAVSFNQNIGGWNTANVMNMFRMFGGATTFNQDIGNWDLSSTTNVNAMLSNSGMDCPNYSSTLNGWAANPNTPDNLTLGANTLIYSASAFNARNNILLATKGWTINGDATLSVGIISGNLSVCVGATTTLTSTSVGGTWSSADPLIAAVNTSTGEVTGVSEGSVVITYIYSQKGCDDSTDVTINVGDNIPPVFVSCISDSTIYMDAFCNTAISDFTTDPELNITDNCSSVAGGTITVTQSPSAGTILSQQMTTVWIYATDNSSNVDSCSFVVTLADTIAPTITCPSDITIFACVYNNLEDFTGLATISDNCSNLANITVTQSPAVGTPVSNGDIITVWIFAEDWVGNIDSCSFEVSIGNIVDADTDGIFNSCDLDDDNDGISDAVENECLNAIIAGYPFTTLQMKPSDFGLSPAGQTGLNLSLDVSDQFGYAANTGMVIVNVTNAHVHPTADEFYTAGNLPVTNWEITGSLKSIVGIEHGIEYFPFQQREIRLYSNEAQITDLNIITPGNWQNGLAGNTYYQFNNSAVEYSTTTGTMGAQLFVGLLDYSDKNFGIYTNESNTGNWSTYFIRLHPECDTDMDGIPNRLDSDSDNDGCPDAVEYYGTVDAIGTDGNDYYGNGNPPATNANGEVTGASYAGNYTNVVTATQLNIVSQPQDSVVAVGSTVTYTVDAGAINTTTFNAGTPDYTMPPAVDGSSGLIYQWQESTDGGATFTNITNGGAYSGATTNQLTVSNVTLGQDDNQYQVVITHAMHPCPALSDVADLDILTTLDIIQCIADTTIYTNSTSCEIALIDYSSYPTLDVSSSCPGTITITQQPAPGTLFSAGTSTTIWIYATDICGNIDSCSFILTVSDTIAPVFYVLSPLEKIYDLLENEPSYGCVPNDISFNYNSVLASFSPYNRYTNTSSYTNNGSEIWYNVVQPIHYLYSGMPLPWTTPSCGAPGPEGYYGEFNPALSRWEYPGVTGIDPATTGSVILLANASSVVGGAGTSWEVRPAGSFLVADPDILTGNEFVQDTTITPNTPVVVYTLGNFAPGQTIQRKTTIRVERWTAGAAPGWFYTDRIFGQKRTLQLLPADTTVNCDAVPAPADLVAEDNCDVEIVFTEDTIAGSCENNYQLVRTWTATDASGNVQEHVQTINVQDTINPVFDIATLPNDTTVNCDAVPSAVTASLTATDNCSQVADITFAVSETSTQGAVGTCAASNYVITRTYTATDVCGNVQEHVQTINVQDTILPTFDVATLPNDTTVNCDAVPSAVTASLTATDNCSQTADITFAVSETSTQGSVGTCAASNYVITRTYTATDVCGNVQEHVQTINVQDTVVPVISNCPSDIAQNNDADECGAVVTWTAPTATDNCSSIVTLTSSHNSGDLFPVGTTTITYTATDICGNESTCSFDITISDTQNPDVAVTISTNFCAQEPVTWEEIVSDNCGIASVVSSHTSGDVFPEGTTEVTITVTDVHGNDSTYSFSVNVLPAPTVTLSVESQDVCAGSEVVVSVTNANPSYSYTWYLGEQQVNTGINYEINSASQDQSGVYTVEVENEFGCVGSGTFTLNVKSCDIIITETFSPNGDGQNEYFYVENLEAFPNTKVWIYNRWGTEVYHSNNYLNDWDGRSQSKLNVSGDELPEGTYFYILQLGGNENEPTYGKVYKGYVYIKR